MSMMNAGVDVAYLYFPVDWLGLARGPLGHRSEACH
jgi:hypothetical protein